MSTRRALSCETSDPSTSTGMVLSTSYFFDLCSARGMPVQAPIGCVANAKRVSVKMKSLGTSVLSYSFYHEIISSSLKPSFLGSLCGRSLSQRPPKL